MRVRFGRAGEEMRLQTLRFNTADEARRAYFGRLAELDARGYLRRGGGVRLGTEARTFTGPAPSPTLPGTPGQRPERDGHQPFRLEAEWLLHPARRPRRQPRVLPLSVFGEGAGRGTTRLLLLGPRLRPAPHDRPHPCRTLARHPVRRRAACLHRRPAQGARLPGSRGAPPTNSPSASWSATRRNSRARHWSAASSTRTPGRRTRPRTSCIWATASIWSDKAGHAPTSGTRRAARSGPPRTNCRRLDTPAQLADALGISIPKLRGLCYHRDAAT